MDKFNSIKFHDSAVLSIHHNDVVKELTLGLRLSDKTLLYVIFKNVFGWDFSPFDQQNILFDLKMFDYDKISDYLYEEYDALPSYKDAILQERLRVAILDSSVGLGGFILFRELIIKNAL